MTNKLRLTLLTAGLALAVAVVFNVALTASDGNWLVSVPTAAVAALAARSVYWRVVGRLANDDEVVVTEHGPDGRLEAIEVFWRPG
ncbi:MAG: hypothetical protein AAGD33_03905 [Actinomycetota bacterium]